jgi:hypothetical protein
MYVSLSSIIEGVGTQVGTDGDDVIRRLDHDEIKMVARLLSAFTEATLFENAKAMSLAATELIWYVKGVERDCAAKRLAEKGSSACT